MVEEFGILPRELHILSSRRWSFVFVNGNTARTFTMPDHHRVIETKLDHMQLVTDNISQLLELCNELSDIARDQ